MEIRTRILQHHHEGTLLEGYFAAPAAPTEPLPAILIAPAWAGCNEQAKERAEILAGLGYPAFAIDLYGNGRTGKTREECAKLMGEVSKDRAFLLERLKACLETLQSQPEVDESRIAALGYCFGGLCVLDMARGELDIRGAISFHGIFNPPHPLPNTPIEARILVLHGFDDPMATPEDAIALGKELTARNADWQIHFYGSTTHAFTNPAANDPDFGTIYNPKSNERSWSLAQDFLREVLK